MTEDEDILADNPQSRADNERIDSVAYALDKVLAKFDETVQAMSNGVADGAIPTYIAAECVKKWRQGVKKLYETVSNQEQLQLVLSLETLRKERGGYVETIERAPQPEEPIDVK